MSSSKQATVGSPPSRFQNHVNKGKRDGATAAGNPHGVTWPGRSRRPPTPATFLNSLAHRLTAVAIPNPLPLKVLS